MARADCVSVVAQAHPGEGVPRAALLVRNARRLSGAGAQGDCAGARDGEAEDEIAVVRVVEMGPTHSASTHRRDLHGCKHQWRDVHVPGTHAVEHHHGEPLEGRQQPRP